MPAELVVGRSRVIRRKSTVNRQKLPPAGSAVPAPVRCAGVRRAELAKWLCSKPRKREESGLRAAAAWFACRDGSRRHYWRLQLFFEAGSASAGRAGARKKSAFECRPALWVLRRAAARLPSR